MSRSGPEAALALLSAGTAMRRAGSRQLAEELACEVDWERLGAILAARRLLAQLGPRIVDLAGEHVPHRFRLAVEAAIGRTRRQAALLQLISLRLTQALEEAGVTSLTLKGAFLAEAIYGDPGRRSAADIDLLVAPEDLPTALEVVRRSGYGAPIDHLGRDGRPLLHYALRHELGQLPPVELHWRVHWYESAFAGDMLDRAVPDPRLRRRASPLDELTSLLLFYARDGFLDLRLAADLGAWWDRFGSGLQPGALEATLDRYPALDRALIAAVTVAERVVGLPGWRLSDAPRRQCLRTRLAARLANPSAGGSSEQVTAETALVDWLLAPRGGQWEFVRRQLLPPRAVLDRRSDARGHPSVSPLGHGARVLGRYLLAAVRVARRPGFSQIPTTDKESKLWSTRSPRTSAQCCATTPSSKTSAPGMPSIHGPHTARNGLVRLASAAATTRSGSARSWTA